MMKVKMMDLFGKDEAFKEINKLILPGKVAFAIARIQRAVGQELETFYSSRVEAVKKYADKDENGELIVDEKGNIHVADELVEKCNKEIAEILEQEVELNANFLKPEWFDEIDMTPEVAKELQVFVK